MGDMDGDFKIAVCAQALVTNFTEQIFPHTIPNFLSDNFKLYRENSL
jgi:hypothetical protein